MANPKHPMLAARLRVLSQTVSWGDELRYLVINDGDVPIMLGAGYGFDRWMSGEWEPVPMRLLVPLWGRRIGPGAQSQDSFPVREDLLPGRYRLRKRLDPDRDPVRGYEWVAKADITPIEPTAEFVLRPG